MKKYLIGTDIADLFSFECAVKNRFWCLHKNAHIQKGDLVKYTIGYQKLARRERPIQRLITEKGLMSFNRFLCIIAHLLIML